MMMLISGKLYNYQELVAPCLMHGGPQKMCAVIFWLTAESKSAENAPKLKQVNMLVAAGYMV